MPTFDLVKSTIVSRSTRARQVEALFDVPAQEKAELRWHGKVPIEERDWNVGLIVGPSGSGKSSVARELFGAAYEPPLEWTGASVIDDVRAGVPVKDITEAFAAVGFNTIPAWLRPHSVLSTGERFRVDVARRLLELPDPIVVDEFTSVVDRQVAQVGSHAIQKIVRKQGRKFVAVGCHYDVIDWLQPDWILEPATMTFNWRLLQRRPTIDVEIRRVDYGVWRLFAPFHYLTSELHRAAQCFALFVGGRPAAFGGMIHFPHPSVRDIKRLSRLVTHPDWQGLGLAFVLVDALGAAYRSVGVRMRCYPAHPALTRGYDRSPRWSLMKEPGTFQAREGKTSSARGTSKQRPCAVFEYCGESMPDTAAAQRLLAGAAG